MLEFHAKLLKPEIPSLESGTMFVSVPAGEVNVSAQLVTLPEYTGGAFSVHVGIRVDPSVNVYDSTTAVPELVTLSVA